MDKALLGWRLQGDAYQPIAADTLGRMWCEQLNLWLGPWQGTYVAETGAWIRLFTKEGELVPTIAEKAEAQRDAADAARTQAEAELARLKLELAEARRRNGKHK